MLQILPYQFPAVPHVADRNPSDMEVIAARLASLRATIQEAITEGFFEDSIARDIAVAQLDDLILMVRQFAADKRAEVA